MMNIHPAQQKESLIHSRPESYRSQKEKGFLIFLFHLVVFVGLFYFMSGCSGMSSHRLQTHFESEPHPSKVIQEKVTSYSQGRLPVGTVIVLNAATSHAPQAITEDTWPQFTAKLNHKIQNVMPVSMQEAIRVDEILFGKRMGLPKGMGESGQIEMVLVVLPSSNEVIGPAQFDLLPEVSKLNGSQTENHATVELGLLDYKSGKLLLHSQGTSYATLDQLDIPLASNRYPRVRGSAMINPIYPEEVRALETLRMLALDEALDQAVMKLSSKWHGEQAVNRSLLD